MDRYADLLRLSAASAGNDHRLGAHEAPPAIISMFLGEQLTNRLDNLSGGVLSKADRSQRIDTGVAALPALQKDDADRNRTSPFAFTGNKFEFRMVGSSQSIAFANVVLNAALSESFDSFATRLEMADDVYEELKQIVVDTMHDHSRILFNGNNYSQEWVQEAKRRGLPILNSSVEAFSCLIKPKNIALFERYGIFTETECHARYEIMLETYNKVIGIEAATMIEMVKRQISPALLRYIGSVATSCNQLTAAGACSQTASGLLNQLTELFDEMGSCLKKLESTLAMGSSFADQQTLAIFMREHVCSCMQQLRQVCDQAETITDEQFWPIPSYTDLMHRV